MNQSFNDHCPHCQGLICQPDRNYQYAGKICYCNETPLKYHPLQPRIPESPTLPNRVAILEAQLAHIADEIRLLKGRG